MGDELRIAVGADSTGWYEPLMEAFEQASRRGVPVRATLVDLLGHDWARNAQGFDAVLWNPFFMGPVSASYFKEKIHFLQNVAGLRVMPNFESVWFFESKVAQSYLLDALGIPRPRTMVSFDHDDAVASVGELGLPVVAKKSYGASSSNVRLLRTRRDVDRYLQRAFAQQLWDARKERTGSSLRATLSGPLSVWFREKVRRKVFGEERHDYVYLQEFLDGNDSDVRIVVAGRRAAGCKRLNRDNDFRASGSGRIVRGHDLPIDAIDLCMEACGRIGADTIAFDVLYKDGAPVIVEMSYVESPSRNPAYWLREDDGTLTRVEGEVWDQELWALHILDEFGLTTAHPTPRPARSEGEGPL